MGMATAEVVLGDHLLGSMVERRLSTLEGFSWLFGSRLLGYRERASFDLWSTAQERAVVSLFPLRSVDTRVRARKCTVYAFWTSGPYESVAVDGLINRAAALDDSVVRHEALRYTGLSAWRGEGRPYGSLSMAHDTVALSLSDPGCGRYAFTHADHRSAPNRMHALWARSQGVDYITPIRGDLTWRGQL